ncbi:5-formyltetrahydrofolate cyclo-ligase [Microbacterium indicum]|uniref:5-formyltetrahydrofolate cyclo-ligase n=1 Tax=Microbacterium indicum TaxID=358100 RepID=UPI0004101D70|nr:5-formyltetrahydrofolate cyclo-ligase [Microbacterium indicum]
MDLSLPEQKDALRRRIRAERRARPAAERAWTEEGIRARGLDAIARFGARTVACYLPTATEPPTRALIAAATAAGVRVLLPIARDDGSLDWALPGGERTSSLRVPEPTGPALGPGALAEADLVLAPATAVDRSGHRLGGGGGFYDRALALLAPGTPVMTVNYDSEVDDDVPREAHDVAVTGTITPTQILIHRGPPAV